MAVYPAGTPAYPIGRAVHPPTWADERGTPVAPDTEVSGSGTESRAPRCPQAPAGEDATETQLVPLIDGLERELKTPAPGR